MLRRDGVKDEKGLCVKIERKLWELVGALDLHDVASKIKREKSFKALDFFLSSNKRKIGERREVFGI